MTGREGSALVRAAGALGMAWGGLLLACGPQLWSAVDGSTPTSTDVVAMRLLAGRHLAQGAMQVVAPTRFRRLFAAADVLHAASMVALAAVDPARRRPALVTAGVAAASAVTTLASGASR